MRRGKRRAGAHASARGGIRDRDRSPHTPPGSPRHRKRKFGRRSGGDSPATGAVSAVVAATALAVLGLAAIAVAGAGAAALGALDGALELARSAGSALGVAVVAVAGCERDREGGEWMVSDGGRVRVWRRSRGVARKRCYLAGGVKKSRKRRESATAPRATASNERGFRWGTGRITRFRIKRSLTGLVAGLRGRLPGGGSRSGRLVLLGRGSLGSVLVEEGEHVGHTSHGCCATFGCGVREG